MAPQREIPHPPPEPVHRTLRLSKTYWRGWRRELPGGFLFLFVLAWTPVASLGRYIRFPYHALFLAALTIVPFLHGTKVQRIMAVVFFALTCWLVLVP